jgi:pyrroloquinoline quinone biosynthesis protein B
MRFVPVEGVVLTDAELDHSLGILLLRESRFLPLYLTAAVRSILDNDSRILPVARAFADMPCAELPLDSFTELPYRDGTLSGLRLKAFVVPAGPPRFATTAGTGHTVGLIVTEPASGRSCAFVPGCGDLTPELLDRIAGADLLLFDGTFWTDNEPIDAGISRCTARQMDHLPIAGRHGSLERLSVLPCRYRVYTHINNTNPILLEQSPEHDAVVQAGMMVGVDGWRVVL